MPKFLLYIPREVFPFDAWRAGREPVYTFLCPSRCLSSACDVSFSRLCGRKCQKVVFSVSGALMPRKTPTSRQTVSLFTRLGRLNFRYVLLSGGERPHIGVFGSTIRIDCVCGTKGPGPSKCHGTVKVLNASTAGALFIKSRVFASIYKTGLTKVHAVLMGPVRPGRRVRVILGHQLRTVILLYCHLRHGVMGPGCPSITGGRSSSVL